MRKGSSGGAETSQGPGLHGILLTYVDDLLLLCDQEANELVITGLQNVFDLKAPEPVLSGHPRRFLGVRIGWEKEKGEITLDQEEYVNDVLATWGMENARGVPSPADQESWREPEKEELTEEERREAVEKAQQVLGSLLWASTRTRPDISFAVGKAASMVSKRPVEAVQRGQRIMRYLAGTRSVGLKYQFRSIVRASSKWEAMQASEERG